MTTRVYMHRYKVLSGVNAGMISDGEQIGQQDFPGQFNCMQSVEINQVVNNKYDNGLCEGVWLNDVSAPLYRPITNGFAPKVEITEEGVNYSDLYMDLCVAFDRFNNEIFVGDTVYAAVNNEVLPCVVEKIAKKPYMAGYGIMQRKVTVRQVGGGAAKTINDSRSMVKVM